MLKTPNKKNGSPAPTSGARTGALQKLFAEVAKVGSREVGRAWVFALALGTVVVRAISGPFFGFSDTWQLVINTGTTIVTFRWFSSFKIRRIETHPAARFQTPPAFVRALPDTRKRHRLPPPHGTSDLSRRRTRLSSTRRWKNSGPFRKSVRDKARKDHEFSGQR